MRKSIAALICALALAGAGCTRTGASLDILKTHYPLVHYSGPKKPPTISFEKTRPAYWAPLSSVSKVAVGAIIVSEDWAFYRHAGIDASQIKEALEKDLHKGRFARGASTITQQVVKNVFLDSEKTIGRKVNEILLALKIEKIFPKTKILEVYLNVAEWGEGVFGIQKAAQLYFNKSPSELTAKEGAFLAMLLPSPKRYSQSFRNKKLTPYASATIRSILNKMVQAHYLSAEDRAVEGVRRLSFESAAAPGESLTPADSNDADPDDEDRRLEELRKVEDPDPETSGAI